MTEDTLNMFDNIVQLVDQETNTHPPNSQAMGSTSEPPKRKGGEGTQRPSTSRARRPNRPKTRPPTMPTVTPIHSKARVQKSIRFRPALVAQLEEHLHSLALTGNERSIQDVMNEALDLWLQTNAQSK